MRCYARPKPAPLLRRLGGPHLCSPPRRSAVPVGFYPHRERRFGFQPFLLRIFGAARTHGRRDSRLAIASGGRMSRGRASRFFGHTSGFGIETKEFPVHECGLPLAVEFSTESYSPLRALIGNQPLPKRVAGHWRESPQSHHRSRRGRRLLRPPRGGCPLESKSSLMACSAWLGRLITRVIDSLRCHRLSQPSNHHVSPRAFLIASSNA